MTVCSYKKDRRGGGGLEWEERLAASEANSQEEVSSVPPLPELQRKVGKAALLKN
jgi:hypothetical protein